MPTPTELAQSHTDLKPDELGHLQRLLGSWSVLADLSFSDLLLLVPVHTAGVAAEGAAGTGDGPAGARDADPELVVLGQMRPNNRPTLVDQDLVGQTVNESQWTLVARCLHSGEIVRGSIHHPILGEQVPVENIPVRFEGHIIGALLRVSLAPLKGPTSMYERTYLDVFERLADMVAQSAFPFPDEDVGTEEAPRVGDGVVVVDADGRRRVRVSERHERVPPHGDLHPARGPPFRRSRHRGVRRGVGTRHGTTGRRGGRAPSRRHRARPLHPAALARRRDRRHDPAARRHRRAPARPAAPLEGCGHPRGPPPGQEQPADDLVAAQPPGTTGR